MAAIQTDPQYKLRLPPDLKARIEQAARDSNRSMNAEIIARLEATFETGVTSKERLDEFARWIAGMAAEGAVASLSRRLGLEPISEEHAAADPEAEKRRKQRAKLFMDGVSDEAGNPTKMLASSPPRRKPDP